MLRELRLTLVPSAAVVAIVLAAPAAVAPPARADDEKKAADDGEPAPNPDPDDAYLDTDDEVEAALDSEKVDVQYREATSFTRILRGMRSATRVNITFTQRALFDVEGVQMNLVARNKPLRDALDMLCRPIDLDWTVQHGLVWIHAKLPGKRSLRIANHVDLTGTLYETVRRPLHEQRTDFNFSNANAKDVLDFISEKTGGAFNIGPKFEPDLVTVQLNDVLLIKALHVLAEQAHGKFSGAGNTLTLYPRGGRRGRR